MIVLLIIWSGALLYAIFSAIQNNIDESLQSKLLAAVTRAQNENFLQFLSTQQMDVKIISAVRDTTVSFRDTSLFNSVEKETFTYRQVSLQTQVGDKAYRIIMRRSMVEYDDLFQAILIMEFIFVVFLVGGLFFINRTILQQLWGPFYATLRQLTSYELEGKPIEWEQTEIDEFQRLNGVLKDMTAQVEKEYQSLKTFTENASHEIQTPISSILNRIEVMLQDESLSKSQWQRLQQVEQTVRMLSRLNKALLLLTKIENRQYPQTVAINLTDLIKDLIPEYQALAKARNISLGFNVKSGSTVKMNPELAEMMFRNLLSNAIRHNEDGGEVFVEVESSRIEISNTGSQPDGDPKQYFERFQKGEASSKSLGLGLSIVLAIVESANIGIDYVYKNEKHIIS